MNKRIAAAIALVIVLLLYFYLSPVYFQGVRIFQPRHFNLDGARNYYTVLSSFIALLGIILGFLYYNHKLEIDKRAGEQEEKRQNLNYLIKELDKYDDLVDEIIHFRPSNPIELDRIREKISRSYEKITTMLMHKTKLFGFNDKDAQAILRVHSFVEQNAILMQKRFEDLTKIELLSVKSSYVDLIQEARKACFEKIC